MEGVTHHTQIGIRKDWTYTQNSYPSRVVQPCENPLPTYVCRMRTANPWRCMYISWSYPPYTQCLPCIAYYTQSFLLCVGPFGGVYPSPGVLYCTLRCRDSHLYLVSSVLPTQFNPIHSPLSVYHLSFGWPAVRHLIVNPSVCMLLHGPLHSLHFSFLSILVVSPRRVEQLAKAVGPKISRNTHTELAFDLI